MGKHLSFWIGFFAASLIIVPVAVGIWAYATEAALNWAAFVFGVAAGLVLVLVLVLFLRDRILARILQRTEASLEDVSSGAVRLASAMAAGDREAITKEADLVARITTNWWAWSNFYRWVIGTAISLLLAFGAFTGTVLLFQQTQVLREQSITLGEQTTALKDQTTRLGEQTEFMQAQTALMEAQTLRLQEQSEAAIMQNEIMALDLVERLREQMLATIERKPLDDWSDDMGFLEPSNNELAAYTEENGSCALNWNGDASFLSPPSQSTIAAIATLADNTLLRERIIAALGSLAQDRDMGVSFGAVWTLDRIGAPLDAEEITFENIILPEFVRFEVTEAQVRFVQSFALNFQCASCRVHARQSMITARAVPEFFAQSSVVNLGGSPEAMRFALSINNVVLVPEMLRTPENWRLVELEPTGSTRRLLVGRSSEPTCRRLEFIADRAEFLNFDGPSSDAQD